MILNILLQVRPITALPTDTIELLGWIMAWGSPVVGIVAIYAKWQDAKIKKRDIEAKEAISKAKESALSTAQVYEVLNHYYELRDNVKKMELDYGKQEYKTEQMEKLIDEIKDSLTVFQQSIQEYFFQRALRLDEIIQK